MDVGPPEDEPTLRPGDVLLFHGHGFVSWAIRRFDGSDVDRASIVLRPETMAESTASGLRHVAIVPAVDGSASAYVQRPTLGVAPASVADQALTFATELPPTNERTVELAVLAMTKRLPIAEPSFRRLAVALLDRAAGIVERVRLRRRMLLFGSEFVYGCFQRTGDPRWAIEIPPGIDGRRRSVSPRPGEPSGAEAVLWEWASGIPGAVRKTARSPKQPLEPLIAAFARMDSPHDAVVPRSYVADAGIVEAQRVVEDAQLLGAAIRFRDAWLRVRLTADQAARDAEDPWAAFRRSVELVTPGDLRYSRSLEMVTSLWPSTLGRRTPRRGTDSGSAAADAFDATRSED